MSTRKRRTKFVDPYADREAQKYDHPIPSREAILETLATADELLTQEQLARQLGLSDERDLEHFQRRLRAMVRDGQLHRNRRGCYGRVERMNLVSGTVIGHADGFGFLAPDDNSDDLFLSPRQMRKVMHGDRAMGQVVGLDSRGRREGAIVEVLEHRHRTIVGRYVEDGVGLVVPEDKRIAHDIFVTREGTAGARSGQIVEVEITQYPDGRSRAMGQIVEVLGDHMAPGMEVDVAIRKFDLPNRWGPGIDPELKALGAEVPEEAKKGRRDLRKLPLVTIDGEDARDFDDAVFCERKGRDWRLVVAIADVSYYVRPDSELDREAFRRGNSVYFPDRVIPMLPEALSNNLCSLMPEVDRLAMVCDMVITAKGKIKSYEFYESVIRSHARLTYNKVAAMLVDGDAALRKQYASLVPHLQQLHELYQALHQVRQVRGAVDFELPETRIVFDSQRKIETIVTVERNDAHRLIEECMLAANVCAAEFLVEHKVPTPYRVHAGPTAEKLKALREFLSEFGLSLGGGDKPEAMDYAQVLQQLEGRKDARLIQTVMLRSLSQAIYSPDNVGHFALAFASYAHFTSPIRRYPDLMVHRSIKQLVHKKQGRGRVHRALARVLSGPPSSEQMDAVKLQSEHCSMTGRRADEAVWDVIKWLKTEFMTDRVGEVFDGVISGVTGFGLFVEIRGIYVEGLVHISTLGNDYFRFEPAKHALIGERTNQVLRLGDEVTVRVVRADLDEARIDFELLEQKSRPRRGPRSKQKGKAAGKKKAARTSRRKSPAGPRTKTAKTSAGRGKSGKKKARRGKKGPNSRG
jgi:ribonuclease R